MAKLDLNARRAARSEAENQPHEVAFGVDAAGKPRFWRLKPKMPVGFDDLLGAGQSAAAMQLLLVDPGDWEELRKVGLDADDLTDIARLYSVDLGESGGSAPSSTNGGPTSSPTSPSTTQPFPWPQPATVPTPSGPASSSA
jgi:hypothetical protein